MNARGPRWGSQAVTAHPITAVQFEWSLLWRDPELELIPAARQLGVGLVPYSPLGRGLLTATLTPETAGDSAFRRHDPRFGATIRGSPAVNSTPISARHKRYGPWRPTAA